MKKLLLPVIVATLTLALTTTLMTTLMTGCDAAGAEADEVDEPHNQVAGKADMWNAANEPTLFSSDLEMRVDQLPMDGAAAQTPWAGGYWPTYEDNINYPWEGEGTDSPATKYAKAFNVTGLEDTISKMYGIDSRSSAKTCKVDGDCKSDKGEACAKRQGQEEGRCIPTWFGICHAWAPVAIMEPEPVHPVTRNGVTFKVNDLKALVTLIHNSVTSKFLSQRCNDDNPDIPLDEFGNPTSAGCKDTNAGTFHVIVTNFLGIKGQAFVEDRTYDDEVWNQPVSAYRIRSQEEISAEDANAILDVPPSPGVGGVSQDFSEHVDKDAWFHAPPIDVKAGAKIRIAVKSSNDPDLYVAYGAQPTDGTYECRPYKGAGSEEICETGNTDTAFALASPSADTQLFVSVRGYDAADFTLDIVVQGEGGGVPTEYVFNDKATRFFLVDMELDYITESSASTDGNLSSQIQKYTRTDRYNYVLEVDKDGKINGGEWVDTSKKNHPDFLWLPTGRSSSSIAGGKLSYAVIKSMLDESVAGPTTGECQPEAKVFTDAKKVYKGKYQHFGPFEAGTGAFEVVLTSTGEGDADLYVREGAKPTTAKYDCRPYKDGSNESCVLEGPGSFYVSVRGYSLANFAVNVTYRVIPEGCDAPVVTPPANSHLDESGHVAQGEMLGFQLQVTAGKKVVIRSTAANDIDLYAKLNQVPTASTYDARAYTASGNETIELTPSASGTLHIGVHGYAASDFTLKTSDN